MRVVVLSPALAELKDAILYYDGEQNGLGYRLWLEVESHMEWITNNPSIACLRSGGYRRVNLKIFPFYIAYIIRGDEIVVTAIAHVRRKPEYWIKRMK